MSISLCMIVKNEEGLLERCIGSVKELVNEIVVVDTGSKDKTVEIAKKLGAKVFRFGWVDDFSKARNYSISKATNDWILVLDADETIAKKDIEKVKMLLKDKKVMGYKFVQRTYRDEPSPVKWNDRGKDEYGESEGYKGWKYRGITRLFKNGEGIKFEYPVHETVLKSIRQLNGKVKSSGIPVHHFPKESRKKDVYYYKLLKKKVKDYPNDAKVYAELGLQALKLGRIKESKNMLRNAAELNKDLGYLQSKYV